MVKIVDKSKKEKILESKIKEMEDLTSKMLSGEKITYSSPSDFDFIIGDVKKKLKAFVSISERTIKVFDKEFYFKAKELVEAYENISREIPRGYRLRGSWSLEKKYSD
ncbi:MAG: hypothetical protein AABX88_01810 [Nanoarchaeota archaeon]